MQLMIQDLCIVFCNLFWFLGCLFIFIFVLGFVIGVNSLMFLFVDMLFLSLLLILELDKILFVLQNDVEEWNYGLIFYFDYVDLCDGLWIFDGFVVYNLSMVVVGEGVDVCCGFVDIVFLNYFDIFGVLFVCGCVFSEDEEWQVGEWVVIFSYQGWKCCGGIDDIVGLCILINGILMMIVGVVVCGFLGMSILFLFEIYMLFGFVVVFGNFFGGLQNVIVFDDCCNGQFLFVGW